MAIVSFFVWVLFGFVIYFIELGYSAITRKDKFTPEGMILYGIFGVVSIFFLLYTVLTHIQRVMERRGKND